MRRNLSSTLLVLASALVIALGCGGGGGGGGSNSSSGGSTPVPGYAVSRLVGIPTGGGTVRDLSNLVVGESLRVRGLLVTSSGVASLVDVTNLETSASSNDVIVDSTTNNVIAFDVTTGSPTVSADLSSKRVSTPLRVAATGTRHLITGHIRTTLSENIAGATVSFYGPSSSTVLASTISGIDGNFAANVPLEATRFAVNVQAFKPAGTTGLYYNVFGYGDDYYDSTLECPATMPSGSGTINLADVVFFRKSPSTVPPAPTGCGG